MARRWRAPSLSRWASRWHNRADTVALLGNVLLGVLRCVENTWARSSPTSEASACEQEASLGLLRLETES